MNKKIALFALAGLLAIIAGFFGTQQLLAGIGSSSTAVESKKSEEKKEVAHTTPDDSLDLEKLNQTPDELVNELETYEEMPQSKEEVVSKNEQAIQTVKTIAQEKKVKVKADIDDAEFRDFIYGQAVNSALPEKDLERVQQLAIVMDLYENKFKNEQIKKLKEKLESGKKLNKKELEELSALLPNRIGLEMKKEGIPTKDLPADEAIENNDGNNNDGNNNNEESTEEENNSNEGNTEEESNNNNDGNTEEEPNNNNGGTSEEETGSEEGTENEVPSTETPVEDPPQDAPETNDTDGYDEIAARDYAYEWWDKRNNEDYGYLYRLYGCTGDGIDCWYDCTNFVSQVIHEGGIGFVKDDPNIPDWYYNDTKPSTSWYYVDHLYRHMVARAEAKDYDQLKVGDIVIGDLADDGDYEHAAFVSKVQKRWGQKYVYVTQHTSDKKDEKLWKWYGWGYQPYGFDVHSMVD
ncbi:amidase domain-containing protein [Mechercharimyces sp. CAU 1602]|uniref:amidase domain-containing protein n=1 Tax=Mechercharimyces sp. CAU 1602 TaxID=2973933 RepID=UPI0021625980|nr:amidase domain-containing protein [Mechercharimyces sp. CAU 1602]MCS1350267.1 amidase domain-containing protein [Mechercharimyces sp. CAU 1602]